MQETLTVFFYKKMREEMELRSRKELEKQLLTDKEMIGELIF
jgi:FAD synthase